MDEFRYFDAIARTREENLVVLRMFDENHTSWIPTAEVLKNMNIYSTPGKIGSGETTDIVEMRKLQRDELSFIEGLVAGIRKGKNDENSKKEKDKD